MLVEVHDLKGFSRDLQVEVDASRLHLRLTSLGVGAAKYLERHRTDGEEQKTEWG